jgi:hypothetical protein
MRYLNLMVFTSLMIKRIDENVRIEIEATNNEYRKYKKNLLIFGFFIRFFDVSLKKCLFFKKSTL